MITKIYESKALTKHISVIVNVNLMTEIVIKIKTGIKVYVNISVKFQRNTVDAERWYLESCDIMLWKSLIFSNY